MPRINCCEYVDIDVDIDIDEFVSSCNKREIEKLKDLLGFVVDTDKMSLNGLDFVNNIEKLSHMYYSLTQEEIDTINKIANKY